jgi:hypothetical protein
MKPLRILRLLDNESFVLVFIIQIQTRKKTWIVNWTLFHVFHANNSFQKTSYYLPPSCYAATALSYKCLHQDADCGKTNSRDGNKSTQAILYHFIFSCFQLGPQTMNFLKLWHRKGGSMLKLQIDQTALSISISVGVLTPSSLLVRLVVSAFWFASSSLIRLERLYNHEKITHVGNLVVGEKKFLQYISYPLSRFRSNRWPALSLSISCLNHNQWLSMKKIGNKRIQHAG